MPSGSAFSKTTSELSEPEDAQPQQMDYDFDDIDPALEAALQALPLPSALPDPFVSTNQVQEQHIEVVAEGGSPPLSDEELWKLQQQNKAKRKLELHEEEDVSASTQQGKRYRVDFSLDDIVAPVSASVESHLRRAVSPALAMILAKLQQLEEREQEASSATEIVINQKDALVDKLTRENQELKVTLKKRQEIAREAELRAEALQEECDVHAQQLEEHARAREDLRRALTGAKQSRDAYRQELEQERSRAVEELSSTRIKLQKANRETEMKTNALARLTKDYIRACDRMKDFNSVLKTHLPTLLEHPDVLRDLKGILVPYNASQGVSDEGPQRLQKINKEN